MKYGRMSLTNKTEKWKSNSFLLSSFFIFNTLFNIPSVFTIILDLYAKVQIQYADTVAIIMVSFYFLALYVCLFRIFLDRLLIKL